MKKLIVVILSILTWFFMLVCLIVCLLVCFPSNEIRGKLAYENILTAHEIAHSLRMDMESFPNISSYYLFTSYEDKKNFMSNIEENLIEHLGFENDASRAILLRSCFMSIIEDEYGEDFSKKIMANTISGIGCINYFCNESEYQDDFSARSAAFARTIISVYEVTGKIENAEEALAEAAKQLQKLKNKDYEHYEALKKYYDNTFAYFNRARLSGVGSDFDSTFEALIHYEDDLDNILDILFEYPYDLDDVFGES